ncbi:hypothetical protein V6Z92_003162 [Aspergillus fumigatus]
MNRLSLIARHLSQIPKPKDTRTTHRAISSTTSRTMPQYTGSCYCRNIRYEISLDSPDDARTSLCHCSNCKVSLASTIPCTAQANRKPESIRNKLRPNSQDPQRCIETDGWETQGTCGR